MVVDICQGQRQSIKIIHVLNESFCRICLFSPELLSTWGESCKQPQWDAMRIYVCTESNGGQM